jgi:DNA-binding transcriptional ArsR family regulator
VFSPALRYSIPGAMHADFAHTAALFSDPGRASILISLLGGVALPAGQLALVANVSPQTASSHLSQLVGGRLLKVEQQGRHRYYRLADAEVAHAIEALMAVAGSNRSDAAPRTRASQVPENLAYARTCYSHLAGWLAVEIADALQKRGYLAPETTSSYSLTSRGQEWLKRLGIGFDDSQLRKSRFARPCLDWSERRRHIAGQLGSAMLERFCQLKWIAPVRESRAVRVTVEGRRGFRDVLGIAA